MNQRFLNIAKWAAIISAISFLLYSIIQLIGYGISTGAITETSAGSLSKIILIISQNFKNIVCIILFVLLITSSIIYFGFILLSKKTNSKSLKIASSAILIINFLTLTLTLSIYALPDFYSTIGIKINTAQIFSGSIALLFGISLIFWKNKLSILSKAIGTFYILEGIIILTTLFIPVRLAEFTIAMRILEAFLFAKAGKIN